MGCVSLLASRFSGSESGLLHGRPEFTGSVTEKIATVLWFDIFETLSV